MKTTLFWTVATVALWAGCAGDDSGDGGGTKGADEAADDSGVGAAGAAGTDTAGVGAGGDGGQAGPGAYQADYQTSDAFFTRMSQPSDSGSVHGTVRIWYSTNVIDLPPEGPFEVPVGTVAIKDEYDASGDVIVKVVMIKKPPGYDTANHDWYYEARNPDDMQARDPVPGKASLCINCHKDSAQTDYLRGFGISN